MLQHQFATAVETVYGTPETPDRFYEFLPGESLGRSNVVLNPSGLRPGVRATLGSRRVVTLRQGAGGVSFEIAASGFGRFFEHMLGGTGDVARIESTDAYRHTYTPGSLTGKSLTLQKGVEKIGGAAQAFTFHGCKILDWEITVAKNALAILGINVDAEDVDTDTALATANYITSNLFHFAQATLSIDGLPIANVSDFSVKGTNALDVERVFLGQSGLKLEPLENDRRSLNGNISAEFANLTAFYQAFEDDTSLELELQFLGEVIDTASYGDIREELTVTLYDVRLTGETPKVAGPAPAVQAIPFEGYETDGGDLVAIEYVTSDGTV